MLHHPTHHKLVVPMLTRANAMLGQLACKTGMPGLSGAASGSSQALS
jgi:hypothetical protein